MSLTALIKGSDVNIEERRSLWLRSNLAGCPSCGHLWLWSYGYQRGWTQVCWTYVRCP